MNAIESQIKTITAPRLTRQQKAAIVVRFLMNEGADINLSQLPPRSSGKFDPRNCGCALG